MADLTGRELEDAGKELFTNIGLSCFNRLNETRLIDIDPDGSYSTNDKLEFDYLIAYKDACLIGEMKGGKNVKTVQRGYGKFRRHFNWIREQNLGIQTWRQLGVPENDLRLFRGIRQLKGFFVTPYLQSFDLGLSEVTGIACLYKSDWDLIKEYSQSLGSYARFHLLHRFNVLETTSISSLMLSKDSHNLMHTPYKKIASGNVGLADLFTFEVSPYLLLPIAQVYRRDNLPDLSSTPEPSYQRTLIPGKLASIRKKLLENKDFMFPNSILAVLSSDCEYHTEQETLIIPQRYGAVSVIDGQHRLFAYANEQVYSWLDNDCKIMVTAIKFHNPDAQVVSKFSARTFVEINTNQTRIHPTLLDAIAYGILGETHPRALAAQIIIEANKRPSALYGLFDTNQTGLGKISATTVLLSLKNMTNLKTIERLRKAQKGSRLVTKRGYENLFEVESIDVLCEAEKLIEKGIVCLVHYFNLVSETFRRDWPERERQKNTSLEYAKMIGGFVKLLWKFISEGLDWTGIKAELEKIRKNIMHLRKDMRIYNAILFDPNHPDIPDDLPSDADDYNFLYSNRKEPTSIQKILSEKKPRKRKQ